MTHKHIWMVFADQWGEGCYGFCPKCKNYMETSEVERRLNEYEDFLIYKNAVECLSAEDAENAAEELKAYNKLSLYPREWLLDYAKTLRGEK